MRARLAIATLGLLCSAPVVTALPAAAAPAYTVQTLHFAVTTGPHDDIPCDIVGDLYLPASASPTSPVPAIMFTNGFAGSKADGASLGAYEAGRGYAVLSYSGLGFGGSSCLISFDDPDYDGKAASQLVSYLGGAPGIAYEDADHTTPAPVLTSIVHDATDHDGVAHTYDPRVGLSGGSYGGGFQFATAGIDHRVDAIVPMITWNDLSYSLDPNNTDQTSGVTSSNAGVLKVGWGGLLLAAGLASQPENGFVPSIPCPSYVDWLCPAVAQASGPGYFQPDAIAHFRHASVASYISSIKVPTLLLQGEDDTLFNLNEAVATYQALKAQHTVVKMAWQHWGHNDLNALPGEWDYVQARTDAWFDHYLKGADVNTGPDFAYYADWNDTGDAGRAFTSAKAYPPAGTSTVYHLSAGSLVTGTTTPGSQSFVAPAAGAPADFSESDPLQFASNSVAPVPSPQTAYDAPGTFASWTTAALAAPADVVGIPVANLQVSAPSAALTQGQGESGQLVLFLKLEDVAPDGSVSTINGLEAPVRIADATKPFTVRLPGIVHRFAAGHRIRFVVAGSSFNYRGNVSAVPVTIASGAGQTLTLPTQ